MANSDDIAKGGWKRTNGLAGVLLVAGLALFSYGSYIHLTIGNRTLGRCDACDPWHPLFVVAPLLLGTALIILAGYLFSR